MTASPYLSSKQVMERYGYKCRKSFWQFVHANGVPHITLTARKLVFAPAALEAWEKKRSIGSGAAACSARRGS